VDEDVGGKSGRDDGLDIAMVVARVVRVVLLVLGGTGGGRAAL
jgi:hypothetical protein